MLIENPFILRLKKFVRDRFPFLNVIGSRVVARTIMFKKERAFLRGDLSSNCEQPSVLFFTNIRTASQFVDSLIERLYSKVDGTALNLPKYFFHADPTKIDAMIDPAYMEPLLKPKGFHLGTIRPFGKVPDPSVYKSVVLVRDPRDVMVSFFYSLAYAHTPADKKFYMDAQEAREKGIEWFVTQPDRIAMVRQPLDFYASDMWGKEGIMCWKYENMMTDFPAFVNELADHICGDVDVSDEVAAIIAEREAQQKPTSEGDNVLKHMRSGKSGQFHEKLKPETCEFLTKEFEGLLDAFGYEK